MVSTIFALQLQTGMTFHHQPAVAWKFTGNRLDTLFVWIS